MLIAVLAGYIGQTAESGIGRGAEGGVVWYHSQNNFEHTSWWLGFDVLTSSVSLLTSPPPRTGPGGETKRYIFHLFKIYKLNVETEAAAIFFQQHNRSNPRFSSGICGLPVIHDWSWAATMRNSVTQADAWTTKRFPSWRGSAESLSWSIRTKFHQFNYYKITSWFWTINDGTYSQKV